MNDIPNPPRPPEPTNVYGNSFIPKRPVPPEVIPPRPVTVPSYVEDESFELYPWVMFLIGFFAGLIIMKFIC
ncbi:hypothetical protein [Acinetobacter sp. NigerLNRRAM0016]